MQKHKNHLARETSPYLLQHATNPVDWYPWGDEALQRAKDEDKPIFLSIGYAACHWCHVMEDESFENEAVAALMNKLFICIKVDREERPDLDQIYMKFVQFSTGSGGWPLSVFLTPEEQPYFGGTYFPPEDRQGRPGFKRVLELAADFYHNKKEQLHKNLSQVRQAFQQELQTLPGGDLPGKQNFMRSAEQLARYYEPEFGGIGSAPKFPAVQGLSLFLRAWKRSGQEQYLDMVKHTLRNMADGGIYDQLAGGFARYSVDNEWFAPHFEKMLYDNAQLASLYIDAWQASGEDRFLQIARQTLDFVLLEMTSAEGGFFSSFDADSEGEEGLYYLWTHDEIENLLPDGTAELFCAYYDVRREGNFEGRNILHINDDLESVAGKLGIELSKAGERLEQAKLRLLQTRKQRVAPRRDDKIILSWNGLMISALVKGFFATGDANYRDAFRKAKQFLNQQLIVGGQVRHTYKDGQSRFDAYLDDYANYIQALLDIWEVDADGLALEQAVELAELVERQFSDAASGGYFYTSRKQQKLIHRLRDESDQSLPSGTGIMALNHLRLFTLTGDKAHLKRAERIFKSFGHQYEGNPYGYASHLNALDFYLTGPLEIFTISPAVKDDADLLQPLRTRFIPNKVLVRQKSGDKWSGQLLSGYEIERPMVDGEATAYVCKDFSCSLPVTNPQALLTLLK